jgi:hypothetical protein
MEVGVDEVQEVKRLTAADKIQDVGEYRKPGFLRVFSPSWLFNLMIQGHFSPLPVLNGFFSFSHDSQLKFSMTRRKGRSKMTTTKNLLAPREKGKRNLPCRETALVHHLL